MLAEQAVAVEGNKLNFNFFLPHDTIKHNAQVVSLVSNQHSIIIIQLQLTTSNVRRTDSMSVLVPLSRIW